MVERLPDEFWNCKDKMRMGNFSQDVVHDQGFCFPFYLRAESPVFLEVMLAIGEASSLR